MRSAIALIAACVLVLACSPASPETTASVAPPQRVLDLTVSGPGSVESTQASCSTSCKIAAASGTVLHLEARPSAGAQFKGWSGSCTGTAACDLRLESDAAAVASFEAVPPPPPPPP
ncbi:MAG TPA: hypothetical protein VFE90_02920, partial [Myxococcales bacterium]|nr:hypothetical protein [Myxococcales bacterium]